MLTSIILLAAFFRLYRLDQLPPGLHYDEAFNATMAQRVVAGIERPLFFREDLTEEPLAIYMAALSFALFGASPFSLRLVSAIAGILTIPALYVLAREMLHSRFAATLAALTLAVLYWHVNFSRLGMEPIFLPLTMTLAIYFLWRAVTLTPLPSAENVQSGEGRGGEGGEAWGLAGFFLALTQYTYKAAVFVPILVAAFLALEIFLDRSFWTRHRRGLVIFGVVAVLVFAPLGLYFFAHPSEFIERPSTVLINSAEPGVLLDNIGKIAGMIFLRGDENPRSNLPGRAALDIFLAVGFIVGLALSLARIRQSESRLILLWLTVMALPSGLTDFAPHFGRAIGMTPAIALAVAHGFGEAYRILRLRFAPLRMLAPAVLVAGFAFSAYSTATDYFQTWGGGSGLYDSFDVGLYTLAQRLRARPPNESILISPVDQSHYSLQFGLSTVQARSFDGRRALVLPEPGSSVAYGIVTREDDRSLSRLSRAFPNGQVIETQRDFTGKPYASIFRAEEPPRVAPQIVVNARLSDRVALVGYDLTRNADVISLTIYWGSIAEVREDYTVFVHLIGEKNPATQSPVWAQDDARPGHGSYPTARWRAGETIIDDYRLVIPADAPRGAYQIEIGMYILETGARVRMFDANGAPMENDRVLLERISLP